MNGMGGMIETLQVVDLTSNKRTQKRVSKRYSSGDPEREFVTPKVAKYLLNSSENCGKRKNANSPSEYIGVGSRPGKKRTF